MKYLVISIFIIYSYKAFSQYHYDTIDYSKYPKKSEERVLEMGRIRSQDGIGNCYAFTLAERFEYYCEKHRDCKIDGHQWIDLDVIYFCNICKEEKNKKDD